MVAVYGFVYVINLVLVCAICFVCVHAVLFELNVTLINVNFWVNRFENQTESNLMMRNNIV